MLNIKRLSLALIALSLNTPAFAADCCNSKVLVPSQHGGFKVGIDALYLRLNGNDLSYATTLTCPTNFPLGLENNSSVDPSYDWGFYAQVGYLFPCTGNDLTLGYTYLNTNDNDSVVAVAAPGNLGISVPPLSALLSEETFGAAQGKAENTLNMLDLEAGQRFTTGSYDLRMFAGLRYANINTTLKTLAQPFATGPINTTVSGIQDFHSQFRGAGPRIGVDARYCLRSGFGLDADLSTSLLVGSMDSKFDASATDGSTTIDFTSRNGSNSRVVPVLEAKLGGDYTYIMDCRCKSTLVIEAGYQVTNYFNALDRTRGVVTNSDLDCGDSCPPPLSLFSGCTKDVAFDGIYLGVKYYA